jgi:hypothetical protein
MGRPETRIASLIEFVVDILHFNLIYSDVGIT